jgi:hypothetical protein
LDSKWARARCERALEEIFHRRGSVWVVKELVHDGGLERSRLRGQFQQLFLAIYEEVIVNW